MQPTNTCKSRILGEHGINMYSAHMSPSTVSELCNVVCFRLSYNAQICISPKWKTWYWNYMWNKNQTSKPHFHTRSFRSHFLIWMWIYFIFQSDLDPGDDDHDEERVCGNDCLDLPHLSASGLSLWEHYSILFSGCHVEKVEFGEAHSYNKRYERSELNFRLE